MKERERKRKGGFDFEFGFAVKVYDIGAVYAPLVVITSTCVTPLGGFVQTSDNVSPGLSVIGGVKLFCC